MTRLSFTQVASAALAAALVLATWLPTVAAPSTSAVVLFDQRA